MSKILVSYFSASGVTKNVAEKIAATIQGDIFEIEPTKKYTNEDLDWSNKESRTTKEMNDKEFRPSIDHPVENIDSYDTVIIGYPIWWYTAPTIINTFIEENNLEGKRIYVFATSGGSGVEKSLNDLETTYPNLQFMGGKRFYQNPSEEEIKSFINEE